MTDPELIKLVAKMRARQQQFFSERERSARSNILQWCKLLERDVDKELAARELWDPEEESVLHHL